VEIAIADLIPPASSFTMVLVRLRQLLESLIETAPPTAQRELSRLHRRVSDGLAPPIQAAVWPGTVGDSNES
jgi:hypothetical protein